MLDAYLWIWACLALTIDMTEKLSAVDVDLYAHPAYEFLWELNRPGRLIILLFRLARVTSAHSSAKLDILPLCYTGWWFVADGNSNLINLCLNLSVVLLSDPIHSLYGSYCLKIQLTELSLSVAAIFFFFSISMCYHGLLLRFVCSQCKHEHSLLTHWVKQQPNQKTFHQIII